jgi:hypothetical protein
MRNLLVLCCFLGCFGQKIFAQDLPKLKEFVLNDGSILIGEYQGKSAYGEHIIYVGKERIFLKDEHLRTIKSFSKNKMYQTENAMRIILKNGSILYGNVYKHFLENWVLIQTLEGLQLTIHSEEVLLIQSMQSILQQDNSSIKILPSDSIPLLSQNSVKSEKQYIQRKSNYFSAFQFGLGFSESGYAFSFQTINGMRLKRNLYLGIGIGQDKYEVADFIPAFAHFRWISSKKANALYLHTDLGYGFVRKAKIEDPFIENMSTKGGIYYRVGIGTVVSLGKISTTFGIAYRLQRGETSYTQSWGWGGRLEQHINYRMSRAEVSIGCMIN